MCEYCEDSILGCKRMITGTNKDIKLVINENKLQIMRKANLFEQGELIAELEIDYCPKCKRELI